MTKWGYLVILCSIGMINIQGISWEPEDDDSQVSLVNVVFRHADRTPVDDVRWLFPNDQYIDPGFSLYGIGQLTNNGKLRAYQFGQVLRKRYNHFLGDMYHQEAVKARSTSIIRSKLSLLLVLAALYPPVSTQKWNPHLNWQPINIINLPARQDGLLLPITCPLYEEAFREVQNFVSGKAELNQFDDLGEELSRVTGKNMSSLWAMYNLYHTLDSLFEMGIRLPDWTKGMFPDGRLRDASVLQYKINSYGEKLNRLNGGVLLHRITNDMLAAINGTSNGRKINLYCAHDVTIAGVLQALGVYHDDIPKYCSAVIVELRVKENRRYVKVLYHLGIPRKTIELKIPGCSVLCPLDEFLILRKDSIASGEELQCDTPEPEEI